MIQKEVREERTVLLNKRLSLNEWNTQLTNLCQPKGSLQLSPPFWICYIDFICSLKTFEILRYS
jgi:hypothetical protein